jgi:gluconate 2-dehydrogenase gamma chain
LEHTRRKFLAQSAGALGLLFLDSLTPQLIAQANEHARAAAAESSRAFKFLTPLEAADFDAFAAQIIPSTDGSPGAREAGVVYFADYALTVLNPEQQKDFRGALAALHAATLKAQPGAASFASLSSENQIAVMKTMDKPPGSAEATNGLAAASGLGGKDAEAFAGLRAMVLTGTFCDPSLHGNRSKVGWNLIGFDDQSYWAPPFGYYDAHQEEKA